MLIKGFSDFSLETPGCAPKAPVFRAHFKLDTDVTRLFPYINALIEDASYYDKPHYIQFTLDGFRCALYPDKAAVALFQDREQALYFVNRLIDFLNDLYARKDSLKLSYKKHEPVPVLDIFRLLPRSNCRECGFPTCIAFAAALSKGDTVIDQCPELNSSTNENAAKLQSMLKCG
jgi:ArsR family metal-binding transcriptional regulator